VDDAAEFSFDHRVDRRLDQFDRGQHVRVERADPGGAIPVPEIARRRAAGVVDEDIGLRTRGERLRAAVGGRDVACDPRDRPSGELADLLGRTRDVLLGARADRDVDAFTRERFGASASQALARCAHERAAARDSKIHRTSFGKVYAGCGVPARRTCTTVAIAMTNSAAMTKNTSRASPWSSIM